jgi:outer membrane lipoprotein SlyB
LPFVLLPGLLSLALTGCHQGYSPDTYASSAAQQEAAVQRGIIIGVRQVLISANGTVGAVTGGAAGGVAGSQVAGSPVITALGAIGGSLVGGIGGTAAAHAVADTKGWEYIVQEPDQKLVSVTQTSKTALPIGLHVLVISDQQQARIVPDYTVQVAAAPAAPANVTNPEKPAASNSSAAIEVQIAPFLPAPAAAPPLQVVPVTVASDPATPAAASTPTPATSGAANKASTTGTLLAGSPANPAPAPGTPIANPPGSPSPAVTP